MSNIYFNTFRETLDQVEVNAAELRAVLVEPETVRNLCREPLNYNGVRRACFELVSYKGKPTKKFFQVVISRLDSGKYELVTYVL